VVVPVVDMVPLPLVVLVPEPAPPDVPVLGATVPLPTTAPVPAAFPLPAAIDPPSPPVVEEVPALPEPDPPLEHALTRATKAPA